ncbi:MAG: cytochrome b/b6 domain-containing protein [Arenicellales bacterium]|nr:cytochrome b/b6 domain-containing protein [Arenicellales bacterium]
MKNRIYLYARFERFWHWSQASLIIFMALTGFEIHAFYVLFGYESAVQLHTTAAWVLIGLWIFAIFWHATTGEWKQYIPTFDRVVTIVRFYSVDIFNNAPHPYHKSRLQKHNPLQRFVYLLLWVLINPAIWISGLLYFFYNDWKALGLASFLSLEVVAVVHTVAAYLIFSFLIFHVYLVTIGDTPLTHIKAMITGWEEVEQEE